MASSAAPPLKVFIMGPPRSGTSVTYYAMREVFGLPGYGESHVFPIFLTLLHRFWQYGESFRKQSGNFAARLNTATLRATFSDYLRNFYGQHYPAGSWVDKTPGADAILSTSLILETFPDARIILTRRGGIEAVQSFRAKFSGPFANACHSWRHCMEALVRVTAEQPSVLVIDQFDLAKTRQPERTSRHAWDTRLTLAATDWTDDEKRTFTELCGDMMQKLEYPF
jgi:hypothetical protein